MSVEALRVPAVSLPAARSVSRAGERAEPSDFTNMLEAEPENRDAVPKPRNLPAAESERPAPAEVARERGRVDEVAHDQSAARQVRALAAQQRSERNTAREAEECLDTSMHEDLVELSETGVAKAAESETVEQASLALADSTEAGDQVATGTGATPEAVPVPASLPVAVAEETKTASAETPPAPNPVLSSAAGTAPAHTAEPPSAALSAEEAMLLAATAAPPAEESLPAQTPASEGKVPPAIAAALLAEGKAKGLAVAAETPAAEKAAKGSAMAEFVAAQAALAKDDKGATGEESGEPSTSTGDAIPAPVSDPKSAASPEGKALGLFAQRLDAAQSAPTGLPQPTDTIKSILAAANAQTAILLPQQKAQKSAEAVATLRALPIEIGMSALKGMRQFTIRLDPAELGKIEVKLSLDDDGKVQAKMTVDRVETLQLLQRDAKTLERAFDQAGLKTSPDSLDFNLRDSGSGAKRQGETQNEHAITQHRDAASDLDTDQFIARADIAQLRQIASAARGGIDRAI